MNTPPVFLHDSELAPLGLWTPEANRIQTMHLTADELAAMKAAKWGWEICSCGSWYVCEYPVLWLRDRVYRAKPAPVTHDVVPGLTQMIADLRKPDFTVTVFPRDAANMLEKLAAEIDSLQHRPQPAATGAVTEPLADGTRYWVPLPTTEGLVNRHQWNGDGYDLRALSRGLIHLTEAAAVAHAKRMTGGV